MIFFWILILVAEIWTISNTGTTDEALPQKKKNETKQNRRHKETMACIFRNNETYSVEGKKDELSISLHCSASTSQKRGEWRSKDMQMA